MAEVRKQKQMEALGEATQQDVQRLADVKATEAVERKREQLDVKKLGIVDNSNESVDRSGGIPWPTYPIQELIDGEAFEGLQKQYDDDMKEFLPDVNEIYRCLLQAKKLTSKWENMMVKRYGVSGVSDSPAVGDLQPLHAGAEQVPAARWC